MLPFTGFVIYDDNKMLAAGWLYCMADVPCGMMEWIVTNPDNSARESLKALAILLEQITWLADKVGLKAVYSKVQNKGLEKLYAKFGFKSGDTSMIDMTRVVA